MVAKHLCEGFPYTHAGDSRRTGFSRSLHTVVAALHGAADAEGALQTFDLSRRRPLGAEATEQHPVVQDLYRLARFLGKKVKIIIGVAVGLVVVAAITLIGMSTGTTLTVNPLIQTVGVST